MDIVQKLKNLLGVYSPVGKIDISKKYPNHEMSNFMKVISDINWSRGYGWFVELDGAPNPFQYGGPLGLPVTNVSWTSVSGKQLDWDSSTWSHSVPLNRQGSAEVISIDLIDDEQATLYTFFENWLNEIYDPYNGILPLSEATKKITIHRFTSERYRVKRKVGNSQVDGYTYFVYPYDDITETLSGDDSSPVKFNVKLRICGHTDLTPSNIANEVVNRVTQSAQQFYEFIR